MPPFILALLQQGLGLIANAAMAKGKNYIEEKVGVKLDAPQLSEEELLKLKQFQLENETELMKLQVEKDHIQEELLKIAMADTTDARDREVAIVTSEHAPMLNKVITPVLALVVVCGGGGILILSNEADVRMAATSLITLVLGYYFGTSVSSTKKQEVLDSLVKK